MSYEPVIGLEIHTQLQTESKIVLRLQHAIRRAAEHAVRAPSASDCLARCRCSTAAPWSWRSRPRWRSGCTVHEQSIFARKNYFYPDLPKGYQISQYEPPARDRGRHRVRCRRRGAPGRHHPRAPRGGRRASRCTRVCRTPTARPTSISTAAACRSSRSSPSPTCASAAEAAECLQPAARRSWSPSGVNDGNMEEGSLRCDANVSVRPAGTRDIRGEDRGQEPQLVPARPARARVRDRAADALLEAGGTRRPGDAAVGSVGRRGRCRCAARKRRTTTATFPSRTFRRCRSNAAGSSNLRAGSAGTARRAASAVRRAVRAARVRRRRPDAVVPRSPTTSRRPPPPPATPRRRATGSWAS